MSKRNAEAEVVKFFLTADKEKAVTVHRLVRTILDQRGAFAPDVSKVPHRVRRPAATEPKSEAS